MKLQFFFSLFLLNTVATKRCNDSISTKATDQYTSSISQWASIHNTRKLCSSTRGSYEMCVSEVTRVIFLFFVLIFLHILIFYFDFWPRIFLYSTFNSSHNFQKLFSQWSNHVEQWMIIVLMTFLTIYQS